MQKLFGIPIDQLTIVLVVAFAIGLAVTAVIALRNLAVLKIAVRNIPRRRTQSILIVVGLMLATLLFSASFTTGDTLTNSVRVLSVKSLGQVDEAVTSETTLASGGLAFFDQAYFEQVRQSLSGTAEVDGVAPLASMSVPVVASAQRLSEPQVDALGLDSQSMSGFDTLRSASGQTLSVADLRDGQAFLSQELAKSLDVQAGDTVQVFFGAQPAGLEVASVYKEGGNPAGDLSLVVPLAQLQSLTGNQGKINSIVITNRGDSVSGASHTDVVLSTLEPVLKDSGLEVVPVKQDALQQADSLGSMFSSIFLLFAQFSIIAGVVLIFLIFVMLAAERKRELGIMRAVGAQRGHVIRLFALEGAAYSLIAAAVGSLLGVVVGWGMVRIMSIAFGQAGLDLSYTFNWRSVVMAYTLGMALTFALVLISSWRVSRLNIVRAIRDIPEPARLRKTVRGLVLTILLLALGAVIALSGLQGGQLSAWMLGTSLVIMGVCLLARRLGLPDRAAFTVAGLGLLLWWLVPNHILTALGKEVQSGIEMFFLSGIMIVLGAVLITIYNADLLLKGAMLLLGRIRGLTPVLKTAVSYPMQNRFRTGATLAMFSLVVFTLVVMSFILSASASVYENTEQISGGFDIMATTSYSNPIVDLNAALQNTGGLNASDFETIAGFNGARVQAMQAGTAQEPVDAYVQGVDAAYASHVTYGFSMMPPGYDSARQVWQTLVTEPDTVVVASYLVPARNNYSMGGPTSALRLEGFFKEDKSLPDVYLRATNPVTGAENRLRVVGVLEDTAAYAGGVLASQQTVNTLAGQTVLPTSYMFRLNPTADAEAVAKTLKSSFLEHGMQTYVTATEIRKSASINMMVNNVLQGFMGLGLVVGIAALGVIAARSVVERRQQIGVLRAIGFQKGMVQLSFMLESSFVALLGIILGVALGIAISVQIVGEMARTMGAVSFVMPWPSLVVVVVIAYGASLLTTYVPARQAARIYPAEALRFE